MNNDIPPEYILCARGGNVIHHIGNKNYRNMVAANKDRYLRGSHVEKRNIVQSIFNKLKDEKYQFMKRNEETGQYEQVDDKKVMTKIAQCFRDKIQEAKASPQNVDASIPADDDHLSNAPLPLGSIFSAEPPHQSNECPIEGIVFLDNVCISPGGSSSADGSVLSDSGSSLLTFTPTFPEAQQQLNDINFDEFSWGIAWEPTRSAAVTMQ